MSTLHVNTVKDISAAHTLDMTAFQGRRVTTYHMTDISDIIINTATPSHTTIVALGTFTFPAKGIIQVGAFCRAQNSSAVQFGANLALRIGAANYWFKVTGSDTTAYQVMLDTQYSSSGSWAECLWPVPGWAAGYGTMSIEGSGIPTGVQSVSLVGGYIASRGAGGVIKGTVTPSQFYITIYDFT